MNALALQNAYLQHIKSALNVTRTEQTDFEAWLKAEASRFNTDPFRSLLMPKLYTAETDAHFKSIAETTHRILEKACHAYLSDPAVRELYGFDAGLEALILSPSPYPDLIPMLRVDIFYDEDSTSFRFCEFNTDGTSGMYEESVHSAHVLSTQAAKSFQRLYDLRAYDLFGEWVKVFFEVYSHSASAVEKPTVAIVDFLESGVSEEFEMFAKAFEAAGARAFVADIRQIVFDGEAYTYKGEKIDAVYRRAVTGEMMRKAEEIPEFLAGIRSGKVTVIGHLRSQTAHIKTGFIVLRTLAGVKGGIYTPQESDFIFEHVPFTVRLTDSGYDYNEVLLHKNRWVVKPADEYASSNVTLGMDVSTRQWRERVEEGVERGYILQEYIEPPTSPNARFSQSGELIEGEYRLITGLYVYNGSYAGVFTRAGQEAIISGEHGGYSVASSVATEKP